MTEFERVFEENKDMIFKYLVRLSGNICIAEELTQETFFRAFMNFSSLRNKEGASVWLCQIAKNTYFAYYKRQKKNLPLDQELIKSSEADSEQEYLEKEDVRRILRYLHELEEPYKEVFMLNVFGELSLKEISELFGKSESWARVTFYRARQKISERMKKDDEM